MRIAMVSEHASPLAALGGVDAGGQNVHVAALAGALGERGHEVTVYTRQDSPGLDARVPMSAAVTVEHVPAGPPRRLPKDQLLPYMPEFGAALGARLLDTRADVVHSHFWMSGVAAMSARRVVAVPVVHTFHALGTVKKRHQGAADTSPAARIRHERELARRCSRVLASSRDERAEVLRMGAAPQHVDIVPSGVDLDVFAPSGPRAGRRAAHRLLVVARLVPRKGVDDAIRVAAQLPDTELVVVGGPDGACWEDDREVHRLRAVANESGAAGRVRFLGSVAHERLAPLLRSADAVLCLPWYEPFGIVPLEAMACGVPVVASAVGGLLDTVVDGVTGVHVPPRDPDAAATAVRRLLADPQRRSELGANAAARADGYSWPRVAELVEAGYEAAVGAAVREEVAG